MCLVIQAGGRVGELRRTGFERNFYMKEINRKNIGRIGLSMAINYFTIQGYTVSLPINDTQWYDLIIEKNGKFETVQCKATGSKDGTISLRNTGGTSGDIYDNVLHHPLDYLFCINEKQNMFLIPVKDIISSGNINSIKLKTEPSKNNIGFQTYLYQVNI